MSTPDLEISLDSAGTAHLVGPLTFHERTLVARELASMSWTTLLLTVDLSDVTEADAEGVAVVALAQRRARRENRSVVLRCLPGRPAARTLDRLGLTYLSG